MNTIDGNQKLAILTPLWGALSETFIRRHLTAILPGRTVAVTRQVRRADWCEGVPMLSLQALRDSSLNRLARAFGQWRYDERSQALRKFLEEHQATTVLGEWLNFAAAWFHNIRDMRLRFFAHAHGHDISRKALARPWHQILYRRLVDMEGVITVSHLSRRRLIDAYRLDPQRVHVIPCGVDVPPPVRRLESDQVVCLSVARMVEKKAPLTTLRAFHLAHRRFPRLRLEMLGDGPLLSACQNYCREHRIAGVVTFHGSRPHEFVKERLAQADLLLLHSVTASDGDEEGLPVAILEGMAYGLPVVSTLHGGIPEAVIDGQTGLLVAEHDEQAMADRIDQLATQPATRGRMGAAGRDRARDNFSAEQEIRCLRELMFPGTAMPGINPENNRPATG